MKLHRGSATLKTVKTNRLMIYLGVALLAVGCKREEGVHAYDAPKDPPPGVKVAVAKTPEADENVQEGAKIHWVVPPEWKQVEAPRMTSAAYQVSVNPPVLLTVSQISARGSEAETVLANVNRWENQMGLPHTSEDNLDKVAMPIKIAGRKGRIINLSSPEVAADGKPRQQMLAALVPDPDGERAWAFKMMGPAEVVAPQGKAFAEVVMSVHFDAEGVAEAPETSASPDGGKIPGIASFTLPQGWQVDPQQHPMRAATIIVNLPSGQGEVVISKLGSTSMSDPVANIVRWRGMVGLPPTADASSNPPQELSLAQGPAMIRDFDGPESAGAARKRMFVAYTQFPGANEMWFFKFIGPHDLVSTSKPAFEAFVKSLKFDDK
jgi:hypothetical protein